MRFDVTNNGHKVMEYYGNNGHAKQMWCINISVNTQVYASYY